MHNEDSFYVPGSVIGDRYLIEDIRRGMMGIVYLCVDKRNDFPIAIKTFGDRYLDSEENRRLFLEEAAMWIQLDSHPNIVRAYSVKIFDEKPHLLMERIIGDSVRGATLKDYFFSTHIAEKMMIQIAIHICNGMIHAINKFPNWVHRDLKSENILFGQDELPKISDFGMTMKARPHELEEIRADSVENGAFNPKQLAHQMIGTPAFAAPEQCLCLRIDTRSDIYSFGCILYHMATKRMPFHRTTVEETIIAHVKEKPVPPEELNPVLSNEFSKIILTCLRKNPIDRYLSFYTLFNELRGLYCDLFGQEPISFSEGKAITYEEHIDRAWSFVLLGRYSIAAKELDAARLLKPYDMEIFFQYGKLRFLQGKMNEALIYLEQARPLMPKDPSLLEMLGKIYFEKSDLLRAQDCFLLLLSIDSISETAYLELAKVAITQNQEGEAEKWLRKGIEVCKTKDSLLMLLANLYHGQNAYNKERDILTQYCKRKADDIHTLLRLSELSLLLGIKREAYEWAKKIPANSLSTFHAWYRLGTIYKNMGDLSKCASAWEEAAARGEGNVAFQKELASIFYDLREFDKAWIHISQAEDMGGDVEELKRKIQSKRLRFI